MKSYGIFLVLLFAFTINASAHQYKHYDHSADLDITAEDVADVNDVENIKKLLLHRAMHIDQIYKDSSLKTLQEQGKERTIFARTTREPGVFNHNDIYSITVVSSRRTIVNHGRYPESFGDKFNLPTGDPLNDLFDDASVPEFSNSADPICVSYNYDGKERTACAIKQEITTLGFITSIMGFHHARDASFVESPDCSGFKLDTTAKQVEDEKNLEKKRELLQRYVKSIIKKTLELIVATLGEIIRDGFDANTPEGQQEITVRIGETVSCFASGDFKYGTIYPFIMEPESGVSFLNGLDFDLHGLSVSLEDPMPIPYNDKGDIEPNVLTAFKKVLTEGSGDLADLANGNNGFVRYHWDNPEMDGDEVEDYLEKSVVPGRSVKESYIEVVDTTRGLRPKPFFFVVGSGIYLDSEMMEEDNDGGCSIASINNTSQGILLNLLLITFALLSTIFLSKVLYNPKKIKN